MFTSDCRSKRLQCYDWWKNLFGSAKVKNDLRAYGNFRKIVTGQGDDYPTGCLLDYNYFKNYYKMIAIDLNKQQGPDADSKAIHKSNFTGHLDRAEGATMLFIIVEAKEYILDFSQGTVRVL